MKSVPPERTGPSPMEVSFIFKPKNRKKKGSPCRDETNNVEPGNIPRLSKLMALAIRFEGLVERGELQDYADLARLGYVTRARITQIMNLLNLAPDIQEELLFLPKTVKGRDPICETDMRPITTVPYWQRQRKMWAKLAAQRLK
jgi:hypothetical protein